VASGFAGEEDETIWDSKMEDLEIEAIQKCYYKSSCHNVDTSFLSWVFFYHRSLSVVGSSTMPPTLLSIVSDLETFH
jgi:hypothetical protein